MNTGLPFEPDYERRKKKEAQNEIRRRYSAPKHALENAQAICRHFLKDHCQPGYVLRPLDYAVQSLDSLFKIDLEKMQFSSVTPANIVYEEFPIRIQECPCQQLEQAQLKYGIAERQRAFYFEETQKLESQVVELKNQLNETLPITNVEREEWKHEHSQMSLEIEVWRRNYQNAASENEKMRNDNLAQQRCMDKYIERINQLANDLSATKAELKKTKQFWIKLEGGTYKGSIAFKMNPFSCEEEPIFKLDDKEKS